MTPSAPEGPKSVWRRNTVLALAAASLTLLAFEVGGSDTEEGSAAPAAPSSSAPSSSAPSSSAVTSAPAPAPSTPAAAPTGGAVASASAGPAASGGPLSARPMIALADAFPAEVPDGSGGVYTKVGAATLQDCTQPDSVGPRLIAMIEKSKGCLGHQVALYKDARNNQFNLSVFTMKDPVDTVRLVTGLSMAFDSYEVGAQAPPPGSGLPTLPPDSGMVQSFAGQGRAMVVGLGQWSDGRVADYQKLVDRLQPLLTGVSKGIGAYETGH
ncbi:hypothetical protein ACWEQL_36485 [Kitasatospora sp. NPDC004240]